ncbi:hypothetical protein AC579_9123 [Pseudocercospora musae]|uniref:Uncharacterized protein n=1 Tax=Pseudocercospora musae TaxID=113226 RepID=A0A139IIR9_9PEZI|nr:hypothetical protein AC579_9123 [Pseudocercospora musae]
MADFAIPCDRARNLHGAQMLYRAPCNTIMSTPHFSSALGVANSFAATTYKHPIKTSRPAAQRRYIEHSGCSAAQAQYLRKAILTPVSPRSARTICPANYIPDVTDLRSLKDERRASHQYLAMSTEGEGHSVKFLNRGSIQDGRWQAHNDTVADRSNTDLTTEKGRGKTTASLPPAPIGTPRATSSSMIQPVVFQIDIAPRVVRQAEVEWKGGPHIRMTILAKDRRDQCFGVLSREVPFNPLVARLTSKYLQWKNKIKITGQKSSRPSKRPSGRAVITSASSTLSKTAVPDAQPEDFHAAKLEW